MGTKEQRSTLRVYDDRGHLLYVGEKMDLRQTVDVRSLLDAKFVLTSGRA